TRLPVSATLGPSLAAASPSRPSASLYELIRPRQQRGRDRETERLGGLEVDGQLELRRLLDGQVAGAGPLEDLVHVGRGAAEEIGNVRPVGHEAAGLGPTAERVHRRQP